MSTNLRQKVLQSFKLLHKTRKKVFDGDNLALSEGRKRINEEYKKNKNVNDPTAIEEMIKTAQEVEQELRTCVIQAKEIKPGVYQATITKDTVKIDNVAFNECLVNATEFKPKKKRTKCQTET